MGTLRLNMQVILMDSSAGRGLWVSDERDVGLSTPVYVTVLVSRSASFLSPVCTRRRLLSLVTTGREVDRCDQSLLRR